VLDLCVLAVLHRQPTHGYEVARMLEAAGVGEVKGGTLYPLLARLEQQELLTATWQEGSGGPRRKCYAVTASGASYLREHGAAWLGLAERAGALLAGASGAAPASAPPAGGPRTAGGPRDLEVEGAKR
jgi:PadR family transcriptional regulator, regulatory protein PadR